MQITDAHHCQWPITSLLPKFFGDLLLCLYYSVHTPIIMLFPSWSPTDKSHDILQKWMTQRRNWPTEMKVHQTNKT